MQAINGFQFFESAADPHAGLRMRGKRNAARARAARWAKARANIRQYDGEPDAKNLMTREVSDLFEYEGRSLSSSVKRGVVPAPCGKTRGKFGIDQPYWRLGDLREALEGDVL